MTDLLVEARSWAFGMRAGERGTVDTDDPEVRQGLTIGAILPVMGDGTLGPAPDPTKGTPCGCGGGR